MPTTRFEPSSIKNKFKREEIARKLKRSKRQAKLERRLAQAKAEADNPAAKKRRQLENVPKTLDNMREFDPSFLTANPVASTSTSEQPPEPSSSTSAVPQEDQPQDETAADVASDPFASYFSGTSDPTVPPKVLVTTSQKATKVTYEFCEELVSVFPGAELIRRKKGKGFEMGRIAGWAADREYSHLVVVNEDMKKPNALTIVYLPSGPTAYFKLTSIEHCKQISTRTLCWSTLPNIVSASARIPGTPSGNTSQSTRLPLFQETQVRMTPFPSLRSSCSANSRYAFRSTEKVALQEIGPRFTLKLRSLRKGLPAVKNLGERPKDLEFDTMDTTEEGQNAEDDKEEKEPDEDEEENEEEEKQPPPPKAKKTIPPTEDEYQWVWKPELETTRRTFFL
ncbi:hypothetical protein NLI96_g5331 [Meripilus lineatus]|uniref:Brix domain-containing protein n=1 Tax=Meripilus lineatus TaxID=2056292 RepID=A0AAD5V5A9_9APHY|nr:hypothetical protein NLI96_g5331 [Physisporinus lineatus]